MGIFDNIFFRKEKEEEVEKKAVGPRIANIEVPEFKSFMQELAKPIIEKETELASVFKDYKPIKLPKIPTPEQIVKATEKLPPLAEPGGELEQLFTGARKAGEELQEKVGKPLSKIGKAANKVATTYTEKYKITPEMSASERWGKVHDFFTDYTKRVPQLFLSTVDLAPMLVTGKSGLPEGGVTIPKLLGGGTIFPDKVQSLEQNGLNAVKKGMNPYLATVLYGGIGLLEAYGTYHMFKSIDNFLSSHSLEQQGTGATYTNKTGALGSPDIDARDIEMTKYFRTDKTPGVLWKVTGSGVEVTNINYIDDVIDISSTPTLTKLELTAFKENPSLYERLFDLYEKGKDAIGKVEMFKDFPKNIPAGMSIKDVSGDIIAAQAGDITSQAALQASPMVAEIITHLGEVKRTDPACVKKARTILEENPDGIPVRGIFDSTIREATNKYESNKNKGTNKQLDGFEHIGVVVNGNFIDNNPKVPQGANFFTEKDILNYLSEAPTTPEIAPEEAKPTEVIPKDIPPEEFDQERGIVSKSLGLAKDKLIPDFLVRAGESLAPLKTQDSETKAIFKEWTTGLLKAEEAGTQEIGKIPKTGDKNYETILKYQAGEETKYSEIIKQEFDKIFYEAKQEDLSIGYIENYIPQVYQEPLEEVKDAMSKYMVDQGVEQSIIDEYIAGTDDLSKDVSSRLKLNPSFSKERAFPSYEVAMKYGLTPKYSEPSQLLAHYRAEFEKTKTNKKFLDDLVDKGKIRTVEQSGSDWEPITIPFSPRGYYAEPKLAKMLNNLFRNEEALGATDMLFKAGAKLSKTMQEIRLSAGIPKTDINFFSIGQLVKNLTAGEFNSAVAFVRANFNDASIKYFNKNVEYLKMMENQGVNILNRVDKYDDIYKTFRGEKGISKKVGFVWDKAFEEKTFKSFLPQLQLQTFKGTYDSAIKKGLSEVEAEKLAGDTTKAFYGLTDNLGRGIGTRDKMSAVLFAPTFRENILNTLFNTAKSVSTEFNNPAFHKNRMLMFGMLLTYMGYNALNKKTAGHYMWDNPAGKEFALMVPTHNENEDVVYVEFMPSFLAFARNMGSGGIALAKGDFNTAKQKLGSLLSMPISLGTELWANRDYFGREIYEEDDSTSEKLKKLAKYTALDVNHPFISEPIKQLTSDKPLYQSISEAFELPLKYSNMSKIRKSEFYDAYFKVQDDKAKEKDDFRPIYDEIKGLIEAGNRDEALSRVNALTDDEYAIYKSLKSSDKYRANLDIEMDVYERYQNVQKLLGENNTDEAKKIINDMSDSEYKAYKRLKSKLQK